MRTLFIATLAVFASASAAFAQETSDRLVMYVGPGPDYETSLGFANVEGDQVRISERMEMQAGCSWSPSEDITVPPTDIVDLREPASVGGPEQFGVLYATTYSALVSYRGGTPAVENHTCVRMTMTSLANSTVTP